MFKHSLNLDLPHDKFLDWLKLKALADNKMNAHETQKLKFDLDRVENIVRKGERKCW